MYINICMYIYIYIHALFLFSSPISMPGGACLGGAILSHPGGVIDRDAVCLGGRWCLERWSLPQKTIEKPREMVV